MAASKINNYSPEVLNLSLLGRALGHPARVKIMTLLNDEKYMTNQELCVILKLNKSTIHNHLKKMYDANLISNDYRNKFALVSRTTDNEDIVNLFLEKTRIR